ncbi:GTP cyclohydrolase FolE2, partial [bacterium]|nr:GTP cyclohydrolase FolE2 [bacterium]
MNESKTADLASLPDVSSHTHAETEGLLNKVGMEGIELPIKVKVEGEVLTLNAKVDAFVSLDNPKAKGIHMSRLYLTLQEIFTKNTLSTQNIQKALSDFIESHADISKSSYLKFNFTIPVKQKSLVSSNWGWRTYPIQIEALNSKKEIKTFVETEVLYSSTCPCSAALARELNAQNFEMAFADKKDVSPKQVAQWMRSSENSEATPHAQRSEALVRVELDNLDDYSFVSIIKDVEAALATPVQAAVKREDEQEFARLNGNNLMFCEDAGRKIKKLMDSK